METKQTPGRAKTMTLTRIWNIEDSLSLSHILEIRRSLPEGATPEDYLVALEAAKAESDRAIQG